MPAGAAAARTRRGAPRCRPRRCRSRALDVHAAPLAGERPDAAQAVGEVAVDVEVAGDVRAGEAELVGSPQQATQGAAVVQDHDGPVGRRAPCRSGTEPAWLPSHARIPTGRSSPTSPRTVAASIGATGRLMAARSRSSSARSARRRGSRRRTRPRSTRGRSPTCGGRCASKPSASTSRTWASNSLAPRPQRAGVVGTEGVDARRPTAPVWSRTVSSIARRDGSAPPGKMYLLIHVYWSSVASMRSCASRIACTPTRPPGASTRSRVAK